MALLRPAQKPPPLSPERIALASAITVNEDRREAIAGTASALERAEEAVREARNRHDAAEAAVAEAQTASVAFAIASARGLAGPAPKTVAQARADLLAAADAAETTRDARAALQAELDNLTSYAGVPEMRLRAAVAEVLAGSAEVGELIERVARLQRELAEAGSALMWLASADAIPPALAIEGGGHRFGPAQHAVARMQSPPATWTELQAQTAGDRPWRVAFEALMTDADAVLPSGAS